MVNRSDKIGMSLMARCFVAYTVASILIKKMVFRHYFHEITGNRDAVAVLFSSL